MLLFYGCFAEPCNQSLTFSCGDCQWQQSLICRDRLQKHHIIPVCSGRKWFQPRSGRLDPYIQLLYGFRVARAFSSLLLPALDGKSRCVFLLFPYMLTPCAPQTSWLQHSANHDCSLTAVADSRLSPQACSSPSEPSNPFTSFSKVQAGTLRWNINRTLEVCAKCCK